MKSIAGNRSAMFAGVVKFLTLIVLLAVTAGCPNKDERWFERNWISDKAATIAANPKYFAQLTRGQRKPFENLFGKMRWLVAGDTLTVIDSGYRYPEKFVIRSIGSGRFELVARDVSASTGAQQAFIIVRQGNGFCADLAPLKSAYDVKECFVPYGT